MSNTDSPAEHPVPVDPAETLTGFRWYAIHTLSNMEAKVKRYLDKFIEVEEMAEFFAAPPGRPLSDRVLMPCEMVAEVRNGKKTTKLRKLYPNYIFLQMRLYGADGKVLQQPWYFVRNVQGVVNFIGNEEPIALKPEEIRQILQRVEEAEGKSVPKVLYIVGEDVKVVDGPFSSMTGRVEGVDLDHGKLQVSVSIFGRFTPVELEFWQVERAEGQ